MGAGARLQPPQHPAAPRTERHRAGVRDHHSGDILPGLGPARSWRVIATRLSGHQRTSSALKQPLRSAGVASAVRRHGAIQARRSASCRALVPSAPAAMATSSPINTARSLLHHEQRLRPRISTK